MCDQTGGLCALLFFFFEVNASRYRFISSVALLHGCLNVDGSVKRGCFTTLQSASLCRKYVTSAAIFATAD